MGQKVTTPDRLRELVAQAWNETKTDDDPPFGHRTHDVYHQGMLLDEARGILSKGLSDGESATNSAFGVRFAELLEADRALDESAPLVEVPPTEDELAQSPGSFTLAEDARPPAEDPPLARPFPESISKDEFASGFPSPAEETAAATDPPDPDKAISA